MNIEARLTDRIGVTGKKLHTGRSRNDQVATDIRLWLRDEIDLILAEITRLQQGLLGLAEAEAGHHHARLHPPADRPAGDLRPPSAGLVRDAQSRDYERLVDCRKRVNRMPLGSAAPGRHHLPDCPRDHRRTAGLRQVAAATRWTACRTATSPSNSAPPPPGDDAPVALLRRAGAVDQRAVPVHRPADRFCTGSSIMPQKKNPDVPELVRGKSGRVFGALTGLLTLMKGQPLAYNKDNQEDKEPLFDAADTLRDSLRAFADMVRRSSRRRTSCARRRRRGFSTATDLADYLVRRACPSATATRSSATR